MTEVANSPEKLTRVFSRTPSSWDPQDDLLLRHLKEQQKLGWKEIASHFNNRTPNACQFRWRRLRSGSLKSATPAATQTPGSSSTSTPSASIVSMSTPNNNYKEPSTSPSASPPPTTASSSYQSRTKSAPMAAYNQWSFSTENTGRAQREDSTDPLSPSLNSLSSSSDESSPNSKLWTAEEDELLMVRAKRSLSLAELSILLPTRTEGEIWSRIDELETRSRSTSVIDIKDSTRSQYLTATPQRSKRHSHSLHNLSLGIVPTPTHRRRSERSFSMSSQTSVGSLSGDLIRSNSFTINPPVLFNNFQQQISERYTLRKESISNNNPRPFKSRSNSIFKTCLATSAIDDDEDDEEEEEEVQDKKNEKTQSLPPLGVLFNDYFTK